MANLPSGAYADLARELHAAYANCAVVEALPSGRDWSGATLDLDDAYAVEAALSQLRSANGTSVIGLKVGFANKAMWRALKLDTLLWASMYSNTVHYANNGSAELSASNLRSLRIEPEIVFKLSQPPSDPTSLDAPSILAYVEWMAVGFEIIDCPFADWRFQPVDFIAAGGFHAGLVIGDPYFVDPTSIPKLAAELTEFKLRLFKDDVLVQEGAGRNCLRSPALCLAELATATAKRGTPLTSGSLISSGTLTEAQLIAPRQVWRAEIEGLSVKPLNLQIT